MVNEFDHDAGVAEELAKDLIKDLAGTNPVSETTTASMLAPELNEMIVRQITESNRGFRPLQGSNLARVGFVGVLASVGVVLVALSLRSDSDVAEITPAISGEPVVVTQTTAEVLTVGPDTTLAAPLDQLPSTTSTSSAIAEPAVTTTEVAAPDTGPIDEDGQEQEPDGDEPCTAMGLNWAKAITAYKQACSAPRADCDPIEDRWMCSSEQIGDGRPERP